MDKSQLRELIKETLIGIDLYSLDAEELIMATIAQESAMGKYLKQITGQAMGITQIELPTFKSHLKWLKLEKNKTLLNKIIKECNIIELTHDALVYNLKFSIAMCRVHYYRVPKELPENTNIERMWLYYKKYYNSYLGAATKEQFYTNYKRYVL